MSMDIEAMFDAFCKTGVVVLIFCCLVVAIIFWIQNKNFEPYKRDTQEQLRKLCQAILKWANQEFSMGVKFKKEINLVLTELNDYRSANWQHQLYWLERIEGAFELPESAKLFQIRHKRIHDFARKIFVSVKEKFFKLKAIESNEPGLEDNSRSHEVHGRTHEISLEIDHLVQFLCKK